MTAYLLTLAVFIPASGWVADRFGARTVFAAAILASSPLASVLCGARRRPVANSSAARILQGIGGAMMVPVGRLVVLRNRQGELMRAIAIITWPALVGAGAGAAASAASSPPMPPGAGSSAQPAARRSSARAGAAADPERPQPAARRPFDWRGFVLGGVACVASCTASELIGRQDRPGRGSAPGRRRPGAGRLAVRHARRHPHPLVDLAALAIPTFAVTIWGGSLFRIGDRRRAVPAAADVPARLRPGRRSVPACWCWRCSPATWP